MIWRIALLTLLLVPVIVLGASGAWARSEPLQGFADQPAIGVGGTVGSGGSRRAAGMRPRRRP